MDLIVKLLGYAPDSDPTISGVLTSCSGVVPTLRGMKGAPGPAATPLAALAATCQGAATLAKLDGSSRLFAGSGKKLYEAGVSTWTDVSRAATYTTTSTGVWRFAQQANVSLAANGSDTLQASVSSGAFSCIPGAPAAAVVETVGAFVLAFNTSTSADQWRCSAINDYTNWSVSVATQAASGNLVATPGPITAARRFGSAVIAYKKNSMYTGVNVGPPSIWQFDPIPGYAGALSQEAVVNIGTPENPKHLFMGEDNFYLYDGSKPVPVGTDRVKVAVFSQLLQSRYYACKAMHDRINNVVYFYYPVADSVIPDHCIVYNYRTDRWGVDDRQVEAVVEYIAPGINYDSLGSTYTTYDALPSLTYDLAFLGSSQAQPAIFDTNHNIKTLTGAASTTSFITGDLGDDVKVFCLNRIRPRFITAPTSMNVTNYYKMNEGDSLSTDTTSTFSGGKVDVLREARWHRFGFALVGDWEMVSFVPEYEEGGLE